MQADKRVDFEVRNPEIEKTMQDLGHIIGPLMPKGFGFTLLIFSFQPGSMFYISNAERDTMIQALREFIDKHNPN